MTGLVLRGAIILWSALFLFLGLRGIVDPGVYADNFGMRIEAGAANTIRADFSAFFIVAAAGGLMGALVPRWSNALLVPAALYGTALVGRIIGATMGDAMNNGIVTAMMIEALSVVLLAGGWRLLTRKPKIISDDMSFAPPTDPLATAPVSPTPQDRSTF
jgi:hypothetical protein